MIFILLLTTALALLNSEDIKTKEGEYGKNHPQVLEYTEQDAFKDLNVRCMKREPEALATMFAEFEKMIEGEPSHMFLALQPIYNLKNEVMQYEVLLRAFDGSNTAPFPLFKNMDKDQWQQFIKLNVNFAHKALKLTGTPISFNLPAFMLSEEFDAFLADLIADVHREKQLIVEISETAFGNKDEFVHWEPKYSEKIKELAKHITIIALDDISPWKTENKEGYPMTLELAKELHEEVAEVKLDIDDTQVMFDIFLNDFKKNQLQKNGEARKAFENEIFNELVKPALESHKKLVFEASVQNSLGNLTEEHQNLLKLEAHKDLVLVQGGETGAFALSYQQIKEIQDQRISAGIY